MRYVYILHSTDGVHLIASNIKVVYQCLEDHKVLIMVSHLRSYAWYCDSLTFTKDLAIPLKTGGSYIISVRPVLSKWVPQMEQHCNIDHVK